MQKHFALIAGSLTLLLAACTASTPSMETDTDTDTSNDGPFIEEEGEGEEMEASSSSADDASSSAATTSGDVRIIRVNVSDWQFNPTTITAKKGEKVKLELIGDSGIHGFAIPGLSMNVRVAAGETVQIDLPTDTVGSFEARCSIPCGPGHRDMKATVVITA